ncbi:MAG: DUF2436 domain-containing protein, partial [Muribaculaceae bacterium]|nr:DUF2436 domain-containing protein [Muribaculaceae bacterium]
MKKFLFVLLTAALALPMMAQTKEAKVEGAFRTTTKVAPMLTLQRTHATVVTREDIPEGYCAVTLQTDDVWGDGSGYQMLFDADATAYGTEFDAVGGSGTFAGNYDNFEYKIPENADPDLYTTNMVCDAEATIFIPAGVYDYVIVNPTPDDRLWIAAQNGTAGGRGDDFEFAAGATYVFHVYLSGNNDATDVEIIDPMAPVMPENVTADVDGVDATVAWTNDHDPAFNLRYRVYNPNMAQAITWDFEDDSQLDGWSILDNDNDGYSWFYNADDYYAHGGEGFLESDSWVSGVGALSPDNWLFSPEITLGGTLTFWAYASWDDVIAVYVAQGEGTNLDDYVKVTDDLVPYYWTEYTVDLSQFRGQTGHFAIRHYNCTDEFKLRIDDITYEVPGDEPAEWTVVNGIEGNEYTIEGLDPETTYEVQVQAIADDGRTTDWTESVLFTTEVGGTTPTERTGAPTFNGYTTDGIHAYFIEILPTEPSTIYYRIQYNDE